MGNSGTTEDEVQGVSTLVAQWKHREETTSRSPALITSSFTTGFHQVNAEHIFIEHEI